jgi:HK97 family phage major capsid protein
MALSTGVDASGGLLIDPIFNAEVQGMVYARPVFLQLANVLGPFSRREVRLHNVASVGDPLFIEEAEAKPELSPTFNRDTLFIREIAAIIVWSDRLEPESFANPGIRSLVQRELAAAMADKIDRALFAADATTDSEPSGIEGLLTQSASFQTLAYGTEADLGEDIRRGIRLARAQNFEPNAIVMHSTALDGLLAIRTSDDQLKFPSVAANQNQSIWGKPIVISNNIPTTAVTDGAQSDVIIADWSKILVGTMPSSVLISNVHAEFGLDLERGDSRIGLIIRARQHGDPHGREPQLPHRADSTHGQCGCSPGRDRMSDPTKRETIRLKDLPQEDWDLFELLPYGDPPLSVSADFPTPREQAEWTADLDGI